MARFQHRHSGDGRAIILMVKFIVLVRKMSYRLVAVVMIDDNI